MTPHTKKQELYHERIGEKRVEKLRTWYVHGRRSDGILASVTHRLSAHWTFLAQETVSEQNKAMGPHISSGTVVVGR